jgi:hypothetical protein
VSAGIAITAKEGVVNSKLLCSVRKKVPIVKGHFNHKKMSDGFRDNHAIFNNVAALIQCTAISSAIRSVNKRSEFASGLDNAVSSPLCDAITQVKKINRFPSECKSLSKRK